MEEGTPPPHAALEAELAALKPRALQRRAEEAGVDESLLDEAEDAAAIVALIIAKVTQEADLARLGCRVRCGGSWPHSGAHSPISGEERSCSAARRQRGVATSRIGCINSATQEERS